MKKDYKLLYEEIINIFENPSSGDNLSQDYILKGDKIANKLIKCVNKDIYEYDLLIKTIANYYLLFDLMLDWVTRKESHNNNEDNMRIIMDTCAYLYKAFYFAIIGVDKKRTKYILVSLIMNFIDKTFSLFLKNKNSKKDDLHLRVKQVLNYTFDEALAWVISWTNWQYKGHVEFISCKKINSTICNLPNNDEDNKDEEMDFEEYCDYYAEN